MKALIILIALMLAGWGLYNYTAERSEGTNVTGSDLAMGSGEIVLADNITMTGNSVTVDAGNFISELTVIGDYRETYMLFGGEHFENKNLVTPIILSGLGIADAKNIYAQYPDFHMCASPGASLAKPIVEMLSLIPAHKQAFNNLLDSIKKHKKNFASGKERICVSLSGKTLTPDYTEIVGKNSTEQERRLYRIPQGPFHLINSVKLLDCKGLLN